MLLLRGGVGLPGRRVRAAVLLLPALPAPPPPRPLSDRGALSDSPPQVTGGLAPPPPPPPP
eukprot:COSAG04_NODE_6465_length_1321_cov_6.988543_3_plen_60_part_01